MDAIEMKRWKDQYLANYNGTSEEAKSLKGFIKKTYKKDVYIPWATMERLCYMQDPEATFEVFSATEESRAGAEGVQKGDPVITHYTNVYTDFKGETTNIASISHFVSVAVTFLGKRITEDAYPIQDKAYDAQKVIDSNMVNKSIKRALTKAAARASGLGLRLYEDGDLQFEDDGSKPLPAAEPTPAPVIPNVAPTALPTAEPTPTATETPSTTAAPVPAVATEDNPVLAYAREIHGNPALLKGVQILNPAIVKKYKFALLADGDTVETTFEKLSKISNPLNTYNTIRVQSGLDKV